MAVAMAAAAMTQRFGSGLMGQNTKETKISNAYPNGFEESFVFILVWKSWQFINLRSVCVSECTFYSNRIGNELVLAVVVLGVCGRFSFYFFISFSFSFWVVVMIATCNVYIIRCVSGCPECLPAIRRRYTLSRRQMYKAVAAVIVLVNVH